MPFEREDTDRVYDDIIAPILREKQVTPVRIDRIEHNDDINVRIIHELQQCDFAIADLTYARPSVYFEAGFAQRNVPVIYTCRKDHFSQQVNDPFGNLRVHFDLQMKNIIPWVSPSDSNFKKRLDRRISRTIAPLLHVRETEIKLRQDAEKFASLSLQEKTERIINVCISLVKDNGYHEVEATPQYQSPSFPILIQRGIVDRWTYERMQFVRIQSIRQKWLGMKYRKGIIYSAFIHVTPTVTKSLLTIFNDVLQQDPIYNVSPCPETGTLRRLEEHIFICSLQKVPISRVMAALTHFHHEPKLDEFVWITTQPVPEDGIPGYSEVYILPLRGIARYLLVRNPKKPFDQYRVDGNLISKYGDQVGWMTLISRRIHLHIVAPIQSEDTFKTELLYVLKKCKV